jgi:hypothetical protein
MHKSVRAFDLAFVNGMLGRFQSNLGVDHWKVTNKVLLYMQQTKDYMLTYRRSDNLEVVGYLDHKHHCCVDSKKSTLHYVFILAREVISWKSSK